MKLLTHNLLRCNIKGVTNGYPLRIEATERAVEPAEFDASFVVKMLGRVDWAALRRGAGDLDPALAASLPEQLTPELLRSEDVLRAVHHVLLEVVVVEGALVCPESGRRFPVSKGIPNMLLRHDET